MADDPKLLRDSVEEYVLQIMRDNPVPGAPETTEFFRLVVSVNMNDMQADREGLEAVLSTLGLAFTDIEYLVSQRLLRAAQGQQISNPSLSMTMWLDGLATGMRYEREYGHDRTSIPRDGGDPR